MDQYRLPKWKTIKYNEEGEKYFDRWMDWLLGWLVACLLAWLASCLLACLLRSHKVLGGRGGTLSTISLTL